jgi:AcrR family transcriptional regulator
MAANGREKIISASFLLFLEHGYKGVSIRKIQEVTQLSKGAIYHHFENKYAIYLAAIEAFYFDIIESVPGIEDGHLDFRTRIINRMKGMIKLFSLIEQISPEKVAYPIRAFFRFQLESEKDDQIRDRTQVGLRKYDEIIVSVVQDGIDSGEIKVNLQAEIIAQQIIIMAEGLAIHNSTLKYDSEAFLNRQLVLLLNPYLDLITQPEKIHINQK